MNLHMDCPGDARLDALVRDRLLPVAAAEVQGHLTTCASCRERAGALEQAVLRPGGWPWWTTPLALALLALASMAVLAYLCG